MKALRTDCLQAGSRLRCDDWFTLYAAVRPLKTMTHTAPRASQRIGKTTRTIQSVAGPEVAHEPMPAHLWASGNS